MDLFNAKYILQENRWPWIDYDKGISIILVGYAHCYFSLMGYGPRLEDYSFLNYLDVFLYGFRMPLFFIVSGMLVTRSLHKKGLSGYIGVRADNILYPLFIWGFLEITIKVINYRHNPAAVHYSTESINYLNLLVNPRVTGHFWYLNALFCIGVIYTVIKSKLRFNVVAQLVLGFVLYCISAYIHIHRLNAGVLTDIFEYYFFFALGDLGSKTLLDEKTRRRLTSWFIFFPLLASFLVVQYFCTTINIRPSADGIFYVEHQLPFLYIFQVLIGCAASMSLSFLLQRLNIMIFLRVVGYHSLYVYCMQIIVMTVMRIVFFNVLKITYVPAIFLLVWASGIILPIFFYNFCLRYNLWWLFTFRKPRKQIEYLQANNIFSLKASRVRA